MRRKDREMDKEFGISIIDKSDYGLISMIDEKGQSYGLPLSIARKENTLYFHSAREGKKVRALKANPKVTIAFVGRVNVPENYTEEELDKMNEEPSQAVQFISSVFTTEFESSLVSGSVKLIEEEDEKIKGMRVICQKYTPTKMDYFDTAIKAGLARTDVYSLEIEEITSKRKKYDKSGKEMKWQGKE